MNSKVIKLKYAMEQALVETTMDSDKDDKIKSIFDEIEIGKGGLLRPSFLTGIWGPNTPKMKLAIQFAEHIASQGKKVVFVSQKKSAHEIAINIFEIKSGMTWNARLSRYEMSLFSEIPKMIKSSDNLYLANSLKMEEISQLVSDIQPELLVIHAAEEFNNGIPIDVIIGSLKDIAFQHDIPVLSTFDIVAHRFEESVDFSLRIVQEPFSRVAKIIVTKTGDDGRVILLDDDTKVIYAHYLPENPAKWLR